MGKQRHKARSCCTALCCGKRLVKVSTDPRSKLWNSSFSKLQRLLQFVKRVFSVKYILKCTTEVGCDALQGAADLSLPARTIVHRSVRVCRLYVNACIIYLEWMYASINLIALLLHWIHVQFLDSYTYSVPWTIFHWWCYKPLHQSSVSVLLNCWSCSLIGCFLGLSPLFRRHGESSSAQPRVGGRAEIVYWHDDSLTSHKTVTSKSCTYKQTIMLCLFQMVNLWTVLFLQWYVWLLIKTLTKSTWWLSSLTPPVIKDCL